ncbi:MAG: sigma-70 family RNA polymerase sigma factor [Coleofasciculaceae cyanobacterium]
MTTQPSLDDIPLLEKIAKLDQVALSELYDRYARVLYALSFKILGSAEEAEEVVLDVFNQVWRTAGRYDAQRGRVDTWLFMLARSRALDKLRALQRLTKAATASVDAAKISSNSSCNPEENLLISERRTQVLAALSKLPQEQREVLELAYYKGLTHVEIAAQTGKSLGTVKTRIRLGLSKLRKALGSQELDH